MAVVRSQYACRSGSRDPGVSSVVGVAPCSRPAATRRVTPMRHDPTARLEARVDGHEPRGRLHDVPPHEVYEVTVDGQRAVYRGNTGPTGRAGTEGRVLSFVGEHTSTPVPETRLVGDELHVAAWHDDAPLPGTARSADVDRARAAGRGLASLHAETAPLLDTYGAVLPGDRAGTSSHDGWHAAAVAHVRDRRPVLARYGHGDVAGTGLERLDGHPEAFAGAGGPVCCHGWATPEHVPVVDGRWRAWSTSGTRSPHPANTTSGGRWSRRSGRRRAMLEPRSGRDTGRFGHCRTGPSGGGRTTRS